MATPATITLPAPHTVLELIKLGARQVAEDSGAASTTIVSPVLVCANAMLETENIKREVIKDNAVDDE